MENDCLFLHNQFWFSSSLLTSTENDELTAIELEILEIDAEITRLRHRRCQLIERQQKLKDTVKQTQLSSANINLVEKWQQTGKI